MSSGNKNVVFNTRERAISTDFNRLQKFASADNAEMLRFMLNVSCGKDDLDAAGVTTEYNALENPLRAEIVNGFLVRPQTASQSCLVDDGVMMAVFIDSDVDSSNYKYVRDPGVTSLSTLSVGANASGQTRIDVIECQVNPDVAIETDNRDIYNGSTDLFTPTSVPKATADQLNYRVRAGTPGAGFPGTASGWLPLCVASVPNGSSNNDTVTFWDVRPLLADRTFAPFNVDLDAQRIKRMDVYGDIYSVGGKNLLRGGVEVDINMQPVVGISTQSFGPARRAGGRIRRGSPGTDVANTAPQVGITDQVDLLDVTNQDPGFVAPTNGYAYVYLAFPANLPRWARYTPAGSSARLPRSPRGILTLSNVGPLHGDTKPSSQVGVPTACGFGSSGATGAACLIAVVPYAAGVPQPTVIRGGKQQFDIAPGGVGPRAISSSPAATVSLATFALVENVDFPAAAKTLLVNLHITFTTVTGSIVNSSFGSVEILDPFTSTSQSAAFVPTLVQQWSNQTGGSNTSNGFSVLVEVPIPSHYPGVTFLQTYKLIWNIGLVAAVGGAPTAPTSCFADIVGWTF